MASDSPERAGDGALPGVSERSAALVARLDALERRLAIEEEQRSMLIGIVDRGLGAVLSSLSFSSGLLERIVDDRLPNIDRRKAIRQLAGLNRAVERAWFELRLLSESDIAQQSALQQVEAVGDENSRALLQRVVATGIPGGFDGARLLRAMNTIARRGGMRDLPDDKAPHDG